MPLWSYCSSVSTRPYGSYLHPKYSSDNPGAGAAGGGGGGGGRRGDWGGEHLGVSWVEVSVVRVLALDQGGLGGQAK